MKAAHLHELGRALPDYSERAAWAASESRRLRGAAAREDDPVAHAHLRAAAGALLRLAWRYERLARDARGVL